MSTANRREMLRAGAALGAGIASGAIFNPERTEACPGGKHALACKWEKTLYARPQAY